MFIDNSGNQFYRLSKTRVGTIKMFDRDKNDNWTMDKFVLHCKL